MSTGEKKSTDPNNKAQEYYDREFNSLTDPKNYEKDGNNPKDTNTNLSSNETQQEGSSGWRDKGWEDTPEYGYYKSFGGGGQTRTAKVVAGFRNASNLKKGLGVGGIAGIVLLIGTLFSLLSVFQLIHLSEMFDNVFDAQTSRVFNSRAAKHYRIALDEDGKSYYKRTDLTGFRGKLFSGYSSLDPTALRTDLKNNHDIDIEVDNRGRFLLNGELVDGKLSNQRNVLRKELRANYPDDRFLKRYTRSRTAFKAMGIQRTFFENSKKRANSWQLEMIDRLRNRFRGDGDINVRASTDQDGSKADENNPEIKDSQQYSRDIQQEANELRTNLEDPEFSPLDPNSEVDPNIAESLKNIDPAKAGLSAAGKALALDGAGQIICEGKNYLLGLELGAMVVRHRAQLKHVGTFAVAAHQLKTGEGVTSGQMAGLMEILNRKPGVGASGNYQLLQGNAGATPKYTDQLTLDLSKTSGSSGLLGKANETFDQGASFIDNLGVPFTSYCKLTRNVAYQIGSVVAGVGYIVISVIGTPFTAGASAGGLAAKTGFSLTLSTAWEALKAVAKPYLVRNLAGPGAIIHYGKTQNGAFLTDALVSGGLALSSGSRYQSGMTQALSATQVVELEKTIALEKAEETKDYSPYKKYVALDNTDSFLAKNLATLPSSPTAAATATGGSLASLPKNFAKAIGLLTPQGIAKAENEIEPNPYITQNPDGIPLYGYTDARIEELNNKYPDPVRDVEKAIYDNDGDLTKYNEWRSFCYPEDNPSRLYGLTLDEDERNEFNDKCINEERKGQYELYAMYYLDRSIMQGMLFVSKFTDCMNPDHEDWDCPSDLIEKAGSFRVATFNVLGASHTAGSGGLASGEQRTIEAHKLIEAEQLSLVGFQEFEKPQRTKFLELTGGGWKLHPANGENNKLQASNSIAWKDSVFSLEGSGFNTGLEYFTASGTRELWTPWVKLKHKQTGEVIFINNTHDPINRGGANAQTRAKNARKHLTLANEMSSQGYPVILTGDFNSGFKTSTGSRAPSRDLLPYCIMTQQGKLYNSYDTSEGRSYGNDGACPIKDNTKNVISAIDHIYHNDDINITAFERNADTKAAGISDHPLIIADVGIGAADASGDEISAEGWTWPISKKDFTRVNNCFEPAPPAQIGHTGIDIPLSNKPVFAANSGEVIKAGNGGDAGNYVMIDHKNGSFSNYQHLSSIFVRTGQEVKAGERIGISGNTGFTTGAHLHFSITTSASLNSRRATGSAVEPSRYLPKDRENPCL